MAGGASFDVVVHCPRCGSTDASGTDEPSCPPGYTHMGCGHCGHTETCDEWELRFRWNARLDRAPGAGLPDFVFPDGRCVEVLCALAPPGAGRDDDVWASQPAALAVRRRLHESWTEPHRRYHTLQHLAECLRWLDDPEVRAALERPLEVEMALWFHDLVYDPRRGDNEERSADEARALLSTIVEIDPASVERIAAHVLATREHTASDGDARVLLDIDLSILGAPPVRFEQYQAQIREEYSWVDADAYREARRAVLARFASRAPLYQSAVLRDRLEIRAKENLDRALAAP